MVLSSLVFLYLFLPANLVLYYMLRNTAYRNAVLIFFSLLFYAWGDVAWTALLLLTTGVNYFFGRAVYAHKGKPAGTRWLITALVFNLSLFVFFKYAGLLWPGLHLNLFGSSIVAGIGLPLGLSYYLFRVIAYLVDLQREEHPAEKNFAHFLLFMSMFHLVIGPIHRYAQMGQELKSRPFNILDLRDGLTRFCIGLFKKVVIANVAGEFVLQYMGGDVAGLNVGLSWFGLVMFALQIYFDFSGYTDMALGLGRMFGFRYVENFNYPYLSRSITEFWRRWHMSLSSFLRDYLFTPLALSFRRQGKAGLVLATVITFVACGFWHGPTWNFVLWGLYFGLLISIELLFLNKWLSKLPRILSHLYFLFAILLGWVLFYFTDMHQGWRYLNVMFGNTVNPTLPLEFMLLVKENLYWLVLALVLCFPVYPALLHWLGKRPAFALSAPVLVLRTLALLIMNAALLALSTAMLVGSSFNAFIYGNF